MKKLTFFLLCLEGAILSFNVAAVAALIPSISRHFLVEEFYAGKLIWLYMVPYGLAALFYGPWVRSVNAKSVELLSMSLFSVSSLIAASAHNINVLFAARLFTGLFGASVIPLALILISRQATPASRGRYVGIFFSVTFVASLLGLFLSGIINWRLVFFIPGIAGLISCIPMRIYLPDFPAERNTFKLNYFNTLKDRKIFSIFTYIFFISIFYHGIQQWLGVYFSLKFGLSQLLISMLITLTSLSGILGEAAGGWFSDLFGRKKVADAGIILMIASIFILVLKQPVLSIALLMIIWGLGWTFNHAAISTMLTDLPQEFLNEAASLNSGVRFLAGGLGVFLSGLFMQKSFVMGFSVIGVCLIGLLISSGILLAKTN